MCSRLELRAPPAGLASCTSSHTCAHSGAEESAIEKRATMQTMTEILCRSEVLTVRQG